MNLPLGSPVMKMKRLRECNGVPVSLELTHINLSLVESLDSFKEFDEHMSLYTYLSEEGGLELQSANESLAAITADREQSSLLHVPNGAPILFVKRKLYTKQHHIIEYCEIYRRTDQFEFSVDYGPVR